MRCAACVLLACCSAPASSMNSDDHLAFLAFEAAWHEEGSLPDLPDSCEFKSVRVRHVAPDEFLAKCGVPHTAAAACLVYDQIEKHLYEYVVPVVEVRDGQPDFDSTGGPVVHELLHAAEACTFRRHEVDIYDYQHSDPRVWIAAGGAKSAQGLAAAILNGD